ncbi:MAG: lytic transglycosylase domain-containing protein [Opitutaceae bacterium]|nr:lytic transglycosylase domain-containing protein [Verrucomicrobiales bacterium]
MILLLSLGLVFSAQAQPADQVEIDPDAVLQFVQENIDEDVLNVLGVDRDRVRQLLQDLQKRFQGRTVYDLASLNEAASKLVPVLQQFDETRPYAAWLQARLDYLEVSEQLRLEATPLPSKKGPAPTMANPSSQRGRAVWVTEVAKRPVPPHAEKYLSTLKPIFVSERMPPELVWVAEAESSFDPSARSPAGAAGLFQLMPLTAKSLDLSLWPRDQRYQPEKNARAAARYLRQLHDRFGDWRLALAAYNAGESRVADLLKKYRARTFDEISPRLPAETQMYVPKVEAILRKREGVALSDLAIRRG